MALDSRRTLSSTDGAATTEIAEGTSLQQRMLGGALEQTVATRELSQHYRYVLARDGRTLSVAVELRHRELPAIRYTLRYLRR